MKNNSVKNLIIVVITFLILISLLIGGIIFFFLNYSEDVKDAGSSITNSLGNKTSDDKDSFSIGEFFSGLFGDDEEDEFADNNIFIENISEGETFKKGDTINLSLKAKDIFEDGNTQVFIGIYSKKDKKYVFDKTIENVDGEINEVITVETGNFSLGEYYIDAIINDTDKKDYDLVENGCVYTTTINIK